MKNAKNNAKNHKLKPLVMTFGSFLVDKASFEAGLWIRIRQDPGVLVGSNNPGSKTLLCRFVYQVMHVIYEWLADICTSNAAHMYCIFTALGASEITTYLYCNCIHLYWEGCVICSIYCGNLWNALYICIRGRVQKLASFNIPILSFDLNSSFELQFQVI